MKTDMSDFLCRIKGLFRSGRKKKKKNKKNGIKKIKPGYETRTVQKIEKTHLREGLPSEEGIPGKQTVFDRIGFDPDYFTAAITRIVASLTAVGLVICAGYRVVHLLSEEVSTAPLTEVSESLVCSATAYILRDETVLYTKASGYADFAVSDGERVAKGDTLCRFYSEDVSGIRAEIAALDTEIAVLKNAVGTGTVATGLEESLADAKKYYSRFMKYSAAGDYSSAAGLEDGMRESFARLAYKTGSGTGLADRLLELQNQRTQLVSEIGKAAASLTAGTAGYYYRSADGCESVLNSSILKNFSEDTYESIVSSAVISEVPGSAGKIAESSVWYLAVKFEGFELQDLKLSSEYTLIFRQNGDTEVRMTLKNSVRCEDGMLFLFYTDILPEDFSFTRSQQVSICAAEYTGYRIPVSALHSLDGMTGVYILDGRYVRFRRINTLCEGTGYVIAQLYSDAPDDRPSVYYTLPYGENAVIGGNLRMKLLCRSEKLERKVFENGKGTLEYTLTMYCSQSGTAVKYGYTYGYYPYLSDSGELILSGSGLYDGKVLN